MLPLAGHDSPYRRISLNPYQRPIDILLYSSPLLFLLHHVHSDLVEIHNYGLKMLGHILVINDLEQLLVESNRSVTVGIPK